jgi:hypothetical protein
VVENKVPGVKKAHRTHRKDREHKTHREDRAHNTHRKDT